MASRRERNEEAFALGFTGSRGTEAGALDSRIEYHKTTDYLSHFGQLYQEVQTNGMTFSNADLSRAADLTRDLPESWRFAMGMDYLIYIHHTQPATAIEGIDGFKPFLDGGLSFTDFANEYREDDTYHSYYHFKR